MSDALGAPTVDDLLEHAEWVRGVARAVSGGSADADELEQDTWLAALRRPPRSDRNLKAWFAQLVRNFARQHDRSERRRQRRERESTPESGLMPSSAELVERAELHRLVVHAVLTLPEPGRSLVLLHYFEGMSLRAIAHEQQTPLETVRSRLHRAIVRLRESLAGVRSSRAWTALVATGAGSRALTATAVAGGLIVSAKTKILAIAAIVAAVAWGLHGWLVETPAERSALPSVVAEPLEVDETSLAATAGATEGASAPATRNKVASAPSRSEVRSLLFGVLVGLRGDAPWTTPLTVHAENDDARGPDTHVARIQVAPDGRFTIDLGPWQDADAIKITADDPRYMPTSRSLGTAGLLTSPSDPLVVEVACACLVRGRVVGEDLSPVARARITAHAMRDDRPVEAPLDGAKTGSNGEFMLRVPFSGECLLAAADPDPEDEEENDDAEGEAQPLPRHGRMPASAMISTVVGAQIDAPPLVLRHGGAIRGHVRWRDGTPVQGASLVANADEDAVSALHGDNITLFWWPDGSLTPEENHAVTDEHGAYRFVGLAPQMWQVRVGWIDGTILHARNLQMQVRAPATGIDFCVEAAELRIHAKHEGMPLESAHAEVRDLRWQTRSNAPGGTARVLVEPNRGYQIIVDAKGFAPQTFGWHAVPGVTERVVELYPQPRRGAVIRLSGAREVRRVRFSWEPLDRPEAKATRRVAISKTNVFVFDDLAPRRYRVRVIRPQIPNHRLDWWYVDAEAIVKIPRSGMTKATIHLERGGRLRIHATDRNGVLLEGTCRVADERGRDVPVRFQVGGRGGYVYGGPNQLMDRGVNEADRLLGRGRYTVRLELDGCDPYTESVKIEPGQVTRVQVRLPRR